MSGEGGTLKQRLVGAIMLVALAVIVIPWLLDGAGVEYSYQPSMQIPVRPPAPQSQLPTQPFATQISRPPQPVAPQPSVAQPASGSADPAQNAASQLEPGVRAWVVQVASVASEPNARGLAEKLRGAGFPAFVQAHGERDKRRYRVRVGPVSRRQQAQAVLERLATTQGQKGVIYNYP